ncbi:hypothetical protein KR038_006690 [Drosophila bunnanda]|nr:hypothetical protein KR038_006690 [Drosophila bunnanda]
MASKSKDFTGEMERLERSSVIKIDNIRSLIHGLGLAEDRVRCSNWLNYLSSSAKNEARVRNCLLDQMERQLRQGHLSQPFNTHVNNSTALHLLLDEEGRERLSRSSQAEMEAPKRSKDTAAQKARFVWHNRVDHLSTLEAQYRREEQGQWLHEFPVRSQPKKDTAIQDIGVQVELPVISAKREGALLEQAPKKQEVKRSQDRERQRDQSRGIQNLAERRQLDIQRREEARQALLKQQLKVKERHDHERFLISKRRAAQSPLKNPRSMMPPQRKKRIEADVKKVNVKSAKEVKRSEPVEEARKAVKCQTCHTATKWSRCKDVKTKVAERERLKMEQLRREKAGQKQETKQGRATAGQMPLEKRTRPEEVCVRNVSEDRNQKRKQEELEKKEKARDESERKQEEERKHQRQLEKEKSQRRLQEELEKKEQAREELERRREEERKYQRQLEKERNQERMQEEQEESERRRRREKRHQRRLEKKGRRRRIQEEFEKEKAREESERNKKADLQRKSQGQLAKERSQRKMQEDLENEEETAEESEQRREEYLQRKSQRQLKGETEDQNIDSDTNDVYNLMEKKLIQKWNDLREKYKEPAEELTSTQNIKRKKKALRAKEKFLKEATEYNEQLCKQIQERSKCRRNSLPNPNEEVQSSLMKENQKVLSKVEATDAHIMALFLDWQKKSTENLEQSNILREKCMHELQHFKTDIQRIFSVAFGDDPSRAVLTQSPKGQRFQGGYRFRYTSISDTESETEESHRSNKKVNDPTIVQETSSFKVLYMRDNIASSSTNGEEGDTESIGEKTPQGDSHRSHREVNDQSIGQASGSVKVLYKRESWPASSSAQVEEGPRRYPDGIGLSYCTQGGRKHYPHICRNASIRRKSEPLHRPTFTRIMKGSRPPELSPGILTGQNHILERKLSVAKKDAINMHIKKSMLLQARRLIEYLVVDKAKAQPKLPRRPIQVLGDPLIQQVDDVSPAVLAAIKIADDQLVAFLKSLFDGKTAHKIRQHHLKKINRPMRELYNQKHMVSDLLNDFCQDDPQLIEILRKIERLYRKWKDQRLDWE